MRHCVSYAMSHSPVEFKFAGQPKDKQELVQQALEDMEKDENTLTELRWPYTSRRREPRMNDVRSGHTPARVNSGAALQDVAGRAKWMSVVDGVLRPTQCGCVKGAPRFPRRPLDLAGCWWHVWPASIPFFRPDMQ